jgi:hypothetical protein
MERIENESFWLGKSRLYRCIRKRESLKGPETPAVIIGVVEVGGMIFELSVRIVTIAFDGRFRPLSASSATSPRKVKSEFGMRSDTHHRSSLLGSSQRRRNRI